MAEWEARFGEADEHAGWKQIALPILQLYTESTDGSYVEAKDSALVRPLLDVPSARIIWLGLVADGLYCMSFEQLKVCTSAVSFQRRAVSSQHGAAPEDVSCCHTRNM